MKTKIEYINILKAVALLQHLGEEYKQNEDDSYSLPDGDEVEPYDEDDYNKDYLVLTNEEADEKAKEYILDSAWAFTPNFLSSFTGFDISIFEAIQSNDKCESNNDAILSMISGKEDEFVEEAISWDGRGHFIASYDFEETEEEVEGQTFYIYKIN